MKPDRGNQVFALSCAGLRRAVYVQGNGGQGEPGFMPAAQTFIRNMQSLPRMSW
jgi:hypothetical protein